MLQRCSESVSISDLEIAGEEHGAKCEAHRLSLRHFPPSVLVRLLCRLNGWRFRVDRRAEQTKTMLLTFVCKPCNLLFFAQESDPFPKKPVISRRTAVAQSPGRVREQSKQELHVASNARIFIIDPS